MTRRADSSTPRLARPPAIGSPFPIWAWEEVSALAALDPQLYDQLNIYEFTFRPEPPDPRTAVLASAYDRLRGKLLPSPQVVVVFSWLKRGGAEWVGVKFVEEAQRRYGCANVLVLVLDWPVDEARDWLSQDTRLCTLMLDAPELDREQRAAFTLHYLTSIDPVLVVNCNSGICWDLFVSHGKALAERTRWGAFAFCYDYTDEGAPVGYPVSHLPDALADLSFVLSDHHGFRTLISDTFGFAPSELSKVHGVYQPIELPPPPPRGPPGQRPRVLWASRICRQKRPDLLLALAQLRPGVDFVVYGDFYEPEAYDRSAFESPNLSYGGSYSTLRELPTHTFDAYAYTSMYDGLPNIVLAAGALKLPIIAPVDVGGIGEVIDAGSGWPVTRSSAQAYAEALDALLADPSQAAARADRLYDRIAARHSAAAYRSQLDAAGVFPAPRA